MGKYIFTKNWGENPTIGKIKKDGVPTRTQLERLGVKTIDEWVRIGLLREVKPEREAEPKRKQEVKKHGRK